MNYPLLALFYLSFISLVTMLTYKYDKEMAKVGRRRVPEKTLHFLALVGGSPAAYYSQQHFRHKTKKFSFQLVFRLIIVAQLGLLAFVYLSSKGV